MNKPNILFIFSDQQHWEAVGYRDESFDTPNLDALAARSSVFNRAYCPTPQCSPSRSSILTGLYPSKTGVMGNVGAQGGNALNKPTIGAALQKAGYHTAYFGKWHLGNDPVGTAGWHEDMGVTNKNQGDAEVTRRGLRFLEKPPEDKPFALFLSYLDPHDIYQIGIKLASGETAPSTPQVLPKSWREKDLSTTPSVQQEFMDSDQGRIMDGRDEQVWELYRELYREKTKLFDNAVGEVISALESSGQADNTVVIATSDHGDMDTQQRLVLKGPFMYDHTLRVPLTIQLPTQTERREINFPTVNVDLAPTMVDIADGQLSAADGVSLLPFLTGEGEQPKRDAVFGQYYSKQQWINPIRTIVFNDVKYCRYASGGEELYDQSRDPDEIHNLAGDPAYAEIEAGLIQRLEAWMSENNDPFPSQLPTDREGQPVSSHA